MKRSRYSEEKSLYVLKQAESGTPVGDVCRQMGISEATFYVWKKKYDGLNLAELRELRPLREENAKLKRLVVDLPLDPHVLQEIVKKRSNGMIESFNGRRRDGCLNAREFTSLENVRATLKDSPDDCNHRRSHGSLGHLTPASSRGKVSDRATKRQNSRNARYENRAERIIRAVANGCLNVIPVTRVSGKNGTCTIGWRLKGVVFRAKSQ